MPIMVLVGGISMRFFKGSAAEANSALAGRSTPSIAFCSKTWH